MGTWGKFPIQMFDLFTNKPSQKQTSHMKDKGKCDTPIYVPVKYFHGEAFLTQGESTIASIIGLVALPSSA